MAIESKHHRPPPVDYVLVSQATRRDAQPANQVRFESYREEYDHWVSAKKRLEGQLAGYSKASFSSEQARIRRENKGNQTRSINAWFSRKAQMEKERKDLIEKKIAAEDEMMRLRPLLKAERCRTHLETQQQNFGGECGGSLEAFKPIRKDGTLSWDGTAAQILIELRAIRKLLEARDPAP